MAGWIKMPLGMEVGLGPGDFALDGDPAPPLQKGDGAPNFRPMSIVAKLLDGSRWHVARRCKGGLFPGYIVLDGDLAPLPQKGAEPSPNFRPISIVANGSMYQDTAWFRGRPPPGPMHISVPSGSLIHSGI